MMFSLMTKHLIQSRSTPLSARVLLYRSIGASTPWLAKDIDNKGTDEATNQNSSSTTNPDGKVETILETLKRPDVDSYNNAMAMIARTKAQDAGSRCEELCTTMEEKSGIAPNNTTFNNIMDAWANAELKDPADRAHRCHEILRRMKSMYDDGIEKMKPTVKSYDTVIHAYTKSAMVDEAEEVLFELLSDPTLEPTMKSFTSVIKAFADQGTEEAALRAQSILDLLIVHVNDGSKRDMAPTIVSFGEIMSAWSRSGAPEAAERCEDLKGLMEQIGIEPNWTAYRALEHTWAESGRPEAHSKSKSYRRIKETKSFSM